MTGNKLVKYCLDILCPSKHSNNFHRHCVRQIDYQIRIDGKEPNRTRSKIFAIVTNIWILPEQLEYLCEALVNAQSRIQTVSCYEIQNVEQIRPSLWNEDVF